MSQLFASLPFPVIVSLKRDSAMILDCSKDWKSYPQKKLKIPMYLNENSLSLHEIEAPTSPSMNPSAPIHTNIVDYVRSPAKIASASSIVLTASSRLHAGSAKGSALGPIGRSPLMQSRK